jgi:hypothetical protein
MMSGEEKSAQIGEAVLLLEQQKRELAHIEEKVNKVKLAYSKFAANSDRWGVDSASPHKVFLKHPQTDERVLPSSLLNEVELAALVIERKNAEEAVGQTKAKLASFGITL